MVWFSFLFKETQMLKKEYEIRYQEVVFRYKFFFSVSIEVEELLAIKRIVLIMAFIIHSSIY